MDKTTQESIIASIRKDFFALRNGMIADTLRKGGLGQKYIFGLQLPQLKETAARFRPENDDDASAIARALWGDKECREARLLACHLMPPRMMPKEEATNWSDDVATREEADILAFKLLRYHPDAGEIAERLSQSDDLLKKYTAAAIQRFL